MSTKLNDQLICNRNLIFIVFLIVFTQKKKQQKKIVLKMSFRKWEVGEDEKVKQVRVRVKRNKKLLHS